jgi:hypothetical protein
MNMPSRFYLYAGVDDGLYEYAIWAPSKKGAEATRTRIGAPLGELSEQGKALKSLCPDMDRVYRRDLGHDENEWEAWTPA